MTVREAWAQAWDQFVDLVLGIVLPLTTILFVFGGLIGGWYFLFWVVVRR
jgi:hypothetical protein